MSPRRRGLPGERAPASAERPVLDPGHCRCFVPGYLESNKRARKQSEGTTAPSTSSPFSLSRRPQRCPGGSGTGARDGQPTEASREGTRVGPAGSVPCGGRMLGRQVWVIGTAPSTSRTLDLRTRRWPSGQRDAGSLDLGGSSSGRPGTMDGGSWWPPQSLSDPSAPHTWPKPTEAQTQGAGPARTGLPCECSGGPMATS